MKTIHSLGLLSLLSLVTLLAACASSPVSDGAHGAAVSAVSGAPAEPASLTGTWAFELSASDVSAKLEERCAQESESDAAKSKACWDDLTKQAAKEKIRFRKDAAGRTVWTSFESDGAKESIFVEVPVELASDGPGHVLAKVSGAPRGEQAERFAKASVNVMRIEVVDARTIAMTDPKKGRLVYTKE